MLSSITQRYRIQTRFGLVWLVFLSFLALYWLRLDTLHDTQLAEAEQRAQLRGSQAAHALSTQVHAQLLGINFVLEHLAEHWLDHDEAVFRKLIGLAQEGIFKGALDVILVTDTEGQALFNSREHNGQLSNDISIADRAYFQQLTQHSAPDFLISAPVLNLVTQRWTVQFSYRMVVNGEFVGVIIASMPVEHLAEAFQQVYPDKDDVVLLTLNNGRYLTRTHALEVSLDTKVPASRDFITMPDIHSGTYTVVAPIDGIERIYAWQRIQGFPVVLSLGLGKDKVLRPVQLSITESRIQNLIGISVLLLAALWITRLVSNQIKQNRARLQAKERLATLLNRVPSGVLLEDENNIIVAVNAKLGALLNLDINPNGLVGLHHQQFLNMLRYEQRSWFTLPRKGMERYESHEVLDGVSGNTFKIDWLSIRREHRYLGHVWFTQDVSSLKQKERALQTLATTDPLTGLHNRRYFLENLQQQLDISQVSTPSVLLMLDIDHFKKVNDTFGHPVGDLVLQNVAKTIRETLRKDDFSGRMGGEEFAVLLPDVSMEYALQLAERIRENIAATPTELLTETVWVTVSIGVASSSGQDKDSIQIDADQALYQAKNTGRNCVCVAVCKADAEPV